MRQYHLPHRQVRVFSALSSRVKQPVEYIQCAIRRVSPYQEVSTHSKLFTGLQSGSSTSRGGLQEGRIACRIPSHRWNSRDTAQACGGTAAIRVWSSTPGPAKIGMAAEPWTILFLRITSRLPHWTQLWNPLQANRLPKQIGGHALPKTLAMTSRHVKILRAPVQAHIHYSNPYAHGKPPLLPALLVLQYQIGACYALHFLIESTAISLLCYHSMLEFLVQICLGLKPREFDGLKVTGKASHCPD